jgi:glutathione S-transferase
MELYYLETMNPRKVCATARYLDLPLSYHRINGVQELKTPEHMARNPNGKVPVLIDGDVTLWESVAIMIYLSNKAGSTLWPAYDPGAQVELMRWISWDLCHWARLLGAYYYEYIVKPSLLFTEPDPKALLAVAPQLHASAKILDGHLAQREYVASDHLTIADFCLGILLPYAQASHMPLEGYAHIHRWHATLLQLSAWREPWPTT